MNRGPVAFPDYLEAKYALDSRSINREVAGTLSARLSTLPGITVLDVGSGTGSGLRRLAGLYDGTIDYTGLDASDENRERADASIRDWAREVGTFVSESASIRRPSGTIRARFLTGDLFAPPGSIGDGSFDLVFAHALLDVLPLEVTVRRLRALLRPGGLLYSVINYDGRTSLYPDLDSNGIASFEAQLLETYDRSMDDRIVGGLPAGGSRTGSKLPDCFAVSGFRTIDFGASDWSVFPAEGTYRDSDALLLEAILGMIADEGARHASIDPAALERWTEHRFSDLDARRLGLIVHQTDILGLAE